MHMSNIYICTLIVSVQHNILQLVEPGCFQLWWESLRILFHLFTRGVGHANHSLKAKCHLNVRVLPMSNFPYFSLGCSFSIVHWWSTTSSLDLKIRTCVFTPSPPGFMLRWEGLCTHFLSRLKFVGLGVGPTNLIPLVEECYEHEFSQSESIT